MYQKFGNVFNRLTILKQSSTLNCNRKSKRMQCRRIGEAVIIARNNFSAFWSWPVDIYTREKNLWIGLEPVESVLKYTGKWYFKNGKKYLAEVDQFNFFFLQKMKIQIFIFNIYSDIRYRLKNQKVISFWMFVFKYDILSQICSPIALKMSYFKWLFEFSLIEKKNAINQLCYLKISPILKYSTILAYI